MYSMSLERSIREDGWVYKRRTPRRAVNADRSRVGLSGCGYRSLRLAVVLSPFLFFSGKPELLLVVVGEFVSRALQSF